MLVNRFREEPRDEGAALVAVVVVMLVGFIIAASVAASVMVTVTANAGNASTTQSFIAAESGRDVAVGSLRSAIATSGLDCASVAMSGNSAPGVAPVYTYTIRSSDEADRPSAWDDAGVTATCPTDTTKWVVISSTGTGPNGTVSDIDSIYPWFHGPATTPSGTVAFFEGQFKATKTTYSGDLVIRQGPYECNNSDGDAIVGDLWVLRGSMTVTGPCIVTGSIYVRDTIDLKNKQLTVGGDVISVEGSIKLTADDASIGGDVYAAGTIDTKNGDGEVGGSFKTHLTMVNHKPSDWTKADGTTPVPVLEGEPLPVIAPTLEQVYEATKWIELTSSTAWSSAAAPVETFPAGTVCTTAQLQAVMSAAGTRAVVDMTGCPAGGQGIPVTPGNVTVNRDVVILVPANQKMNLQITGTISRAGGTTLEDGPQLFIVHLDPDGSDGRPSCSQNDNFTASGTNNARTFIYSACGVNSTMSLTMSGQLYMGSDGLHLNGGTFSCKPMSWEPTLPKVSCGVKGEGGIYDPTVTVTRLENLAFQTER